MVVGESLFLFTGPGSAAMVVGVFEGDDVIDVNLVGTGMNFIVIEVVPFAGCDDAVFIVFKCYGG